MFLIKYYTVSNLFLLMRHMRRKIICIKIVVYYPMKLSFSYYNQYTLRLNSNLFSINKIIILLCSTR